MNFIKGKVLMHDGLYVNEYMLHQGLYSTTKPSVHWDEELTIDKFIEQWKFVSDATGLKDYEEMYDNIRKCEFVDVVMIAPDTGKVGYGSARMGGKTLSTILHELYKVDPEGTRIYREAVEEALKIDEEE